MNIMWKYLNHEVSKEITNNSKKIYKIEVA